MRPVRTSRPGVVVAVLAALLIIPLGEAHGGDPQGSLDSTERKPDVSPGGGAVGAGAGVRISTNAPEAGKPMAPARDVAWEPPACWYKPMWKPKEYKEALESSSPPGAVLGDYADEFYAYKEKRKKQKYNVGKKGTWWALFHDGDRDLKAAGCLDLEPDLWVPEGEKPDDPHALNPKILAMIAYKKTRLPAPPVKLSPATDRQVVNLDTHVSFKAPLDRVWVTASIDYPGMDVAATTVATPASLKVDAGTADADPRTCTYDLTKADGKDGYRVDSKSADCNITYKRATAKGAPHTFTASLVWDVTWTDSADPDGAPVGEPALPDGQSTYEQPVTVKEVQSIVRD